MAINDVDNGSASEYRWGIVSADRTGLISLEQ